MSGTTKVPEVPVESVDDLVAFLRAGEKPPEQWRVGTEHEKLGLHVAFGRSEHFGGTVGPDDFSAPDRVIHLDRVYIPEVQPRVIVREVDLSAGDRTELAAAAERKPARHAGGQTDKRIQ